MTIHQYSVCDVHLIRNNTVLLTLEYANKDPHKESFVVQWPPLEEYERLNLFQTNVITSE